MCGLAGMIDYKNGFYAKDKELFQDLLIVNSLRGAHSTGIFGGKIEHTADYAKVAGNPYEFITHPSIQPVWSKMVRKWRYVVGHGRQATRGKITPENAHPFQVGHITMVHNGTIWASDKVKANSHDVDSMAIAHALNEHSPEEVFSDINGAFAVIWHDSITKRLNLVRNKERPLCIGYDEENKRVMFASEQNMLLLVAGRKGIKFKELFYMPEDVIFSFDKDSHEYDEIKVPKKMAKVYQMPVKVENTQQNTSGYAKEGRLIAVTSKSSGMKFELNDEVEFYIKEVVPFTPRNGKEPMCHVFGTIVGVPEVEVACIWKGKEEELYQTDTWSGKLISINRAPKELEKKGITYSFYLSDVVKADTVTTFGGWVVDKYEFVELTKSGCDCCKQPISLEDAEETLFADNFVFCPKCSREAFEEGVDKMKVVN